MGDWVPSCKSHVGASALPPAPNTEHLWYYTYTIQELILIVIWVFDTYLATGI